MKKQLFVLFCFFTLLSVKVLALPITREVNGIWYSLDSKELTAEVTQPVGSDIYTYYSGVVNVPSTVTYEGNSYTVIAINNRAFMGQGNLTTIIIPKTVKIIDYEAFSGCTSLQSVVFSSNGVLEKIERRAFEGCSITSLNLPNSLISIGEDAFKGCEYLKSIKGGDNIEILGNNIFQGCISLTDMVIPKSVKEIGDYAFWECRNLKSVTMNEGLEIIGNDAFLQCQMLDEVNFSNTVKEIGWEAFRWCINLKQIEIPNSVVKMGYGIFRYCTWLESIKLSESITEIPGYAFEQTSLKSIQIPNSVKIIMPFAFRDCSYLKDVVWSNSLAEIGEQAFLNTGIEYVDFPESLFKIGGSAFAKCEKLEEVSIPYKTTVISDGAFSECKQLTSVFNYSVTPQTIPYTNSPFSSSGNPIVHVYEGLKELYASNIGWEQAIVNGISIVDDIPALKATSITVDNSSYNCGIGETGQATATVLPKNTFKKDLSWSSSDESILHVDEITGQFVGLEDGQAIITVTTTDGTNLQATAIVNVGHQTDIKTPVGYDVKHSANYNIYGQRITNPIKGLYIINGKKYIYYK